MVQYGVLYNCILRYNLYVPIPNLCSLQGSLFKTFHLSKCVLSLL